ncbi:conserved hypothetical protein [Beutenbergia cavernae DSM 12333]|uniref:DinB-like domain-containing protein n=1 Tax=Beutenbergia cavernae (strain ATCC BAA-8 / DSM 12333 / CCUG 43141 / JCM 11478 / NBRC 16432 / NCIMB 13614 / HKI 0122) TaxID=471853 RepID=C5C2Y6_BEUC1|nr:DinB family protein [Beutenbergia cavernae]ACQ81830.1 conserved hypothetical protein [Beutenbergia cavernae DSM 12333]
MSDAPDFGSIVPDTKDWTWVLRRPCPECGFDPAEVDPAAIGAQVRSFTPRWRAALGREGATVRPDPATWSPTEYACHVRDVYLLFDTRLTAMLTDDDPLFANWDQDVSAVEEDYAHQEPDRVADELAAAAEVIAARFDVVASDDLERTGRRSDGSVFTVRTFGQYFLHDVVHHLHDVGA